MTRSTTKTRSTTDIVAMVVILVSSVFVTSHSQARPLSAGVLPIESVLSTSDPQPEQFKEPTTATEVEGFIIHYDAKYNYDRKKGYRFLSAIDMLLSNEERDPNWAGPIESAVVTLVADSKGLIKINSGGCKASLCKYNLEVDRPDGKIEVRFAGAVKNKFEGTQTPVRAQFFFTSPSERYAESSRNLYIFSLTPGVAYVDAVRRILGETP